jgi:demethylmenaquinone methyltransferase/2-methoxy-6-polyprenyl-1,4-benzoquinol methylase
MAASIRDRPKTPQSIFSRVAPYYDALNAAFSLGRDQGWRRETVLALGLSPGARVLDVATGTGGLALEIVRRSSGQIAVTACDLNERMLSVARRRAERALLPVNFVRCDATALPFSNDSFDAVSIGFAIDDMHDRQLCVREMQRVLRPGGQIALLELGQPETLLLRAAYLQYLKIFRVLRQASINGYSHLEQEILGYRGAAATQQLLVEGGFAGYRRVSLSSGIACLHLARK